MIEPEATIASESEIWPHQSDADGSHIEPDHADINTQEDYEPPRD